MANSNLSPGIKAKKFCQLMCQQMLKLIQIFFLDVQNPISALLSFCCIKSYSKLWVSNWDFCFSDFVYSFVSKLLFLPVFFSFLSVVSWYTLVWRILCPAPISKLLPIKDPQNNIVTHHSVYFTGHFRSVFLQSWGSWSCFDRSVRRSNSESILQCCFSNNDYSSSTDVTS